MIDLADIKALYMSLVVVDEFDQFNIKEVFSSIPKQTRIELYKMIRKYVGDGISIEDRLVLMGRQNALTLIEKCLFAEWILNI